MARGLAALQRWLGRAQLWLSSPWDDSGAVFTSAVLLFLVCHDTLACSGRQSPIEVPGAGPSEQKSRSGLPLIDAPAFAHRSCAQKILEQVSPGCSRCTAPHSWMRHVCWALLATTTMALLKPPTPGECFCGKTRISLIDTDAIVSSSICHCSVCRRLCGAPFCANLLTPCCTVHKP